MISILVIMATLMMRKNRLPAFSLLNDADYEQRNGEVCVKMGEKIIGMH